MHEVTRAAPEGAKLSLLHQQFVAADVNCDVMSK